MNAPKQCHPDKLYKFLEIPELPEKLPNDYDFLNIPSIDKFTYDELCKILNYRKNIQRITKLVKDSVFHFSKFFDLNDPMEGIFRNPRYKKEYSDNILDILGNEKEKYNICSFSSVEAKNEILMWSHYANGFKGIRIEITIDTKQSMLEFYKISYLPPKKFFNYNFIDARNILIRKLMQWEYEHEIRCMTKLDGDAFKIGSISEIAFGRPYDDTRLPNYYKVKDFLKSYFINECKITNIVDVNTNDLIFNKKDF